MTTTFEQVLDLVSELPVDQQKLLIEIVQHRTTEQRRKEIAQDCRKALEEFRQGNLKPLTAEEAILELTNYLHTPDIE